MNTVEIWKDILGYEGKYQISNRGRVKSLSRQDAKGQPLREKILKAQDNGRGYKKIALWSNKVSERCYIHRLVAIHFIENPYSYPVVNHIDEDPSNNQVDNLEWCTQSYNTKAGSATDRRLSNTDFSKKKVNKNSIRNLIRQREKQKKKVYQYSLDNIFIKEWLSVSEAAKFVKGHGSNIANCANGRKKSAYGFLWRY